MHKWGVALRVNKILIFPVLFIILIFAVVLIKQPEKAEGVLDEIDSYQGYTRVVSQEEYEFYQYFVERELPEKVSKEELDQLVREYAGEVNAVFYLGNRLGFCEPYSFEAMELRVEQENTKRQLMLEQGEVVYGLEQFSKETYFQYTMDNLQADLQGYLEAQADEDILKRAEEYYEAHEEEFIYRKEVHYEQSLDGVTESLIADVDMLSFLGKADMGLADFLGIANVGDVYEDDKDGQARKVVLTNIIYSEKGYEYNADMALYRLIRDELYDEVIKNTAKNNPVQFETN